MIFVNPRPGRALMTATVLGYVSLRVLIDGHKIHDFYTIIFGLIFGVVAISCAIYGFVWSWRLLKELFS